MISTSIEELEELGSFYLGSHYELDTQQANGQPLLYRAKDLTTHAVCLGMTGSGKTGLCITLLEEAAIDGIPAIAIDLKGDITNLLLTFPELRPADFEPWVDAGEAREAGVDAQQLAAETAERWRKGLKAWGQSGDRIARLRETVEMAIYTPASDAGIRLALLRSFCPPPQSTLQDGEALQEHIHAAVSGLLTFAGLDSAASDGREQTLLANLLGEAWRQGQTLSLADLVRQVQSPPFERLGVLELETFFPQVERTKLALKINNLIASPTFASWIEGEPLEIDRLLRSPAGKPRLSIISIAHLDARQRMFFVTLLLDALIGWMRAQPGTSSLRALLYIDEVFGYLPPTAQPPSKRPLLTLLKQARAYGLGVLLATQNPVDLDYKALSNAGTWFLGRLQTERDKLRVIEGLEGASVSAGQSFDRARLEATLAGLEKRVFLLNRVGTPEPVLFHTRWAMSYLRGPLTRTQIRALMSGRTETDADEATAEKPDAQAAGEAKAPQAPARAASRARPIVPSGIQERFLSADNAASGALVYRPVLWVGARLHFALARLDLDTWQSVAVHYPLLETAHDIDWDEATLVRDALPQMHATPQAAGSYIELPARLTDSKRLQSARKRLKTHLYRDARLTLWRCPALKLYSEVGETESAFRARALQALREKRDEKLERIEDRYAKMLEREQAQLQRAEERLERERSQLSTAKSSTALSVGATVLGALLGRRLASRTNVRGAASAARSAGRISKEAGDVKRAEEKLEGEQEDLGELEERFRVEVAELKQDFDPAGLEIEEKTVAPRKSDIEIKDPMIVWTPSTVDGATKV